MAVAAALTLSGCSGGSSGDDGTKQQTASATVSGQPGAPAGTASPSATAATPATASATTSAPAGTGDPTQRADGIWQAVQGGGKVQLVLGKGAAGLTSTHLCAGTYTDQDGIGLTLTCADGDKERTAGRGVLAADGKTLTVRWAGGPTDTFTRSGLPGN